MRWRRGVTGPSAAPKPIFYRDIGIPGGEELRDALLEQGLSPDEVILKYCWPSYAPPEGDGIRAIANYESLGLQFERLIAMHRVTPAHIPLPLAKVTSEQGEFAGYLLEYVSGDTLGDLISFGMIDEARRQVALVEAAVAKLHAKSLPHGDVTAANVIAAHDGRTLLIDPVASPGPGTRLQDELCLAELRAEIEKHTQPSA
jgi:serine/threonine protein kinase